MLSVVARVVFLTVLTQSHTASSIDSCPSNWFKCGNGRCISEIWVCDGDDDCGNFKDEEKCENMDPPTSCLSSQFECLSDRHCIPERWHCDGDPDCHDKSDEDNCENTTECNGFRCRDHHCIPTKWHCDGQKDCPDGSDEESCPTDKLCTDSEFLCSTGSCVNNSVVCDGKKDCLDGSDEGSHCGDACANATCSQKCRLSPSGPQCYCDAGYTLDRKDNKTCLDINECLEDGFCSHTCINTKGSYRCSCLSGYELRNRSCVAAGADPLLLFTTVKEVRGISLRSNRYFHVRRAIGKATAVDADPANQRIYWVEVSNKSSIYSAKIDGTGFKTILSHGLLIPEDIAVDHVAKNLYLTDSGLKQVLACKMDGTMCHVLHDRNIEKPRSLVLDPIEGFMYWSDWGEGAAGIYRSGMDGSRRITFVATGIAWPNGIAIDHTTNRLYWADAKLNTIQHIGLDGNNRKVLLNETMFHPYSLAVFEDNIYWTDWASFSLESCNKFTGHKMTILARENGRHVMGVHVYHPVLYSGVSNPCWSNTCSHMCLIAPSRKFQCACPPGFDLSSDGRTCARTEERTKLVFVTEGSRVFTIRPEAVGSGAVVELPLSLPTELISRVAYDWESKILFVADLSTPSIMAINMTSLHKWVLVKNQHLESPADLAFDGMSNNLYWVDTNKGTVEVISIRNLHMAAIVKGLSKPIALAISPERGLMFVATEVDPHNTQFPVMMYDIDGKNKRMLKSIQGYPMALAIHPSQPLLYWTDPKAGSISYTNYSNSRMPKVLRNRLDGVLSIDVSEEYVYWMNRRNELNFLKGNLTHTLSLPGPDKKITVRKVTFSSGRPIGKTSCWIGNGGCSFLCLTSTKGTSCVCQSGMTLAADNKTCTAIKTCGEDEFKCARNGRCIPLDFKCDGSRDCDDGSDEMNCTDHHHTHIRCSGGDFKCRNGRCIIKSWVCDQRDDCHDNSDEENCPEKTECAEDQFTCGDGECLPTLWRCDGETDCPDSTDEINCNVTRCDPRSQTRCDNGQCIPISWTCDGTNDCIDGTDEKNCSKTFKCASKEFKCGDGTCIDEFLKCDGRPDCKDGSDEKNCSIISTACKRGMFQCNDGACIYDYEVCDGHKDCSHGEEELNCNKNQCQPGSVSCPASKRCILLRYVCDGDLDCTDGSDESNCTKTTPIPRKINQAILASECDQFFCYADDRCLPWSKVCDGYQDCDYVPDEGRQCSRACAVDNGGCSQICIKSPEGSRCACQSGYRLLPDKRTCDDIDECLELGACSHYCNNTKGSFKCSCEEGYFLHGHSQCKIMGGQATLVLLLGDQIREINFHSRTQKVIIDVKNADIRGMDYDATDGVYYWTESVDASINLYSPDTKKQDVVIRVDSRPMFVKYDWLTKNLYFTDDDGNVRVVTKDGKYTRILVQTRSSHIDSMDIAPIAGFVFWTIWASSQKYYASGLIERAEMDGSHRLAIVSDKIIYPSAITVDHVLNLIYWTDYKLNIIECADFNGLHRRQIVEKNVYYPNSLTLFEDHVYWADWGTNSINSCNKFGKQDCSKFQENEIKPRDIMAVHPLMQLKGKNRCLNHNCSQLCLPTRSSFVCQCADNYILRNNTCVLKPPTSPTSASFEEGDLICPEDFCHAGGTCRVENNYFICSCLEPYAGTKCEIKIDPDEKPYDYSWLVLTSFAVAVIAIIVLVALICRNHRQKIQKLTENVSVKFRKPMFSKGGRLIVDTDDGGACDELVLGQEGEYKQTSFGNPLFGKKPYTLADANGDFKRWPSYDSEDSAFASESQTREGSRLCNDTAPALAVKDRIVQIFRRS